MSSFHRLRLISGIDESHQIPIQSDWAYAIRKQARLIMVPLFRKVIVSWEEGDTGNRPFLSKMIEDLYMGIFETGSIPASVHSKIEKIISKFLESLETHDLAILRFYFLSKENEMDAILQEVLTQEDSNDTTAEEDYPNVGRVFQERLQNMSREELTGFLMEEMGEVENILSDDDLECGLDAEAITRINESFSEYLDLPYGEISLIQYPVDDWDFWEKLTAEEPQTIGKRVHTERGLEWVECWLFPDGKIRIKGDFSDKYDLNAAAIQAIKTELPVILRAIHQELIKEYGLSDSHIHYNFFTQRKTLENIVQYEGIQFFVDQIQGHGADDFEPYITIDIRRYKKNTLQEWGTRISLGIEQRNWLSEDEEEEYELWIFAIESQETPLEIGFSEKQRESIIKAILENIHRCYQINIGQG